MNIKEYLEKYNILLSDNQVSKFEKYYQILVETNKKFNLTAITDYDMVMLKHFIDSAAVVSLKSFPDIHRNDVSVRELFRSGISLIDVGTGAGFPGIPLKLIFPEIKLTLADSLNKRVNFLNDVVSVLGLKDVECIHGRAEDLAHQNVLRETFDVAVSRAVANISVLSEYCIPFIKTGGYFISYKTNTIEQEINDSGKAIEILGGNIDYVYHYSLGDDDMNRSLLFIEKIKPTPKKYPRKAGVPSKTPLH